MESNESKADDADMHPAPRPSESDADAISRRNWFGRRKRIVAREVATAAPAARAGGDENDAVAAVEREMRSAALGVLKPADVIDVPPALAGRPAESVIDP